MFKIFSYLKFLDEKVFSFITDLKNNEHYTNLNQKILSLDEPYQKIIQLSSFFLILLMPIFTLSIIVLFVFSLNGRIDKKKQIIELVDLQLTLNKQVQGFSNTLISSLTLNSEEDVKSSFSANPLFYSILSKVTYTNFSQTPLIANYKDSQITMRFNQVSTPDLANLIKFFYEQYKARIVQTSINRSPQNKLIQGEISFNIISN